MLSRNFYSLDEVEAVLFHTNGIFWCQELLLSGCTSEAISILFQSWLWNTCSVQWLVDAWKTLSSEEVSENDILIATYKLSCMNRDNSLWNILILTIQNPDEMPDRVTRKTPSFAIGDEKQMYFMRAIYQGKARCAFWISQFIDIWDLLHLFADPDRKICLEALQHYEQLLGYKSDEYDMIVRCAAIICIIQCNIKIKDVNDIILHPYGKRISIPNEYLYGITFRGRRKWLQNNVTQLHDIEKYLPGCPYWEEAAEEATTMYKEDFYDKYFPDGTPDTWSDQEKEKSHGGGVLGPAEKIRIWKYSRNFMSNMSRFAWNTTKTVNNYLKDLDIEYEEGIDCFPMSIMKQYVKPVWKDVCLKPVQKILTI